MRPLNYVVALIMIWSAICVKAEEYAPIAIPYFQIGNSVFDQNGDQLLGDGRRTEFEIKATLKRDAESKTGVFSPRTICEFYNEIYASLPREVADNLYENWSRDGLLDDFSIDDVMEDRVYDIATFFTAYWDLGREDHPLARLMGVGDATGKFLSLINKSKSCGG